MNILDILKSKIMTINNEILRLQSENKSLKLELENINSENNNLLKRSEDMLLTIDKTLSSGKYQQSKEKSKEKSYKKLDENDIDIFEIIEEPNG